MRYRQEIIRTFLVPLISSAVMGGAAYGAHLGLMSLTKQNTIATLAACVLAVLVYGIVLLLLKGVKEKELLGLPKGTMIVAVAKKLRLL